MTTEKLQLLVNFIHVIKKEGYSINEIYKSEKKVRANSPNCHNVPKQS